MLPRDAHHATSRQWYGPWLSRNRHVNGPILLLSEVGGAIARRTGSAAIAHQAIDDLLTDPALTLFPTDGHLGEMAARLAADLHLRGADALYVALALYLDVPLITWDDQQRERASHLIEVYRPGELSIHPDVGGQ